MDKRILRTRRILGSALIELLQEQPLHRITVRQITDRADVAYSTFFRNFETVEDLLQSYLGEFLTGLHGLVNNIEADNLYKTSLQTADAIVQHMSQNQAMYQIILTIPAIRPALNPFIQNLIAHHLKTAQPLKKKRHKDNPPAELLVYNAINSLFAMIEWWLKQNSPPEIEQMMTHYEKMVILPIWQLLSGDDTP